MRKTIYTVLMMLLCNLALAEGSVLVETALPRKMVMHREISGYGTVVPEQGAAMNLNYPRAGRVSRLLASQGQLVSRGTVLLEVSADPSGMLAYSQAENAVEFARGELVRVKSLFEKQLATRSQVEAADRSLKDAEGALKMQREMGNGEKKERLLSPFDGVVSSVVLSEGDRFSAGTNLIQVTRTDFLLVRMGIAQDDRNLLAMGMKVHLASVFNKKEDVTGEVAQIAGQVDPQTQLVSVTVRFKGGMLLPGLKVRGDIAIPLREAIAVPRSAILKDDAGAYLFQVQAGRAHRVSVEAGLEDQGWVEVKNALQNAPVVTLGNYELEDSMAVREAKR